MSSSNEEVHDAKHTALAAELSKKSPDPRAVRALLRDSGPPSHLRLPTWRVLLRTGLQSRAGTLKRWGGELDLRAQKALRNGCARVARGGSSRRKSARGAGGARDAPCAENGDGGQSAGKDRGEEHRGGDERDDTWDSADDGDGGSGARQGDLGGRKFAKDCTLCAKARARGASLEPRCGGCDAVLGWRSRARRMERVLTFFCKSRGVTYLPGFEHMLYPIMRVVEIGVAEEDASDEAVAAGDGGGADDGAAGGAGGDAGEPADESAGDGYPGPVEDEIEGLSYTLFLALVSKHAPLLVENEPLAVQSLFQLFRLLVLYHDPGLCTHLDEHLMRPEIYAQPWLLSLLARSCAGLDPCVALWDTYLIDSDPFLNLFASLSLLLRKRDSLMGCGSIAELRDVLGTAGLASVSDVEAAAETAKQYQAATPRSFRKQLHTVSFRPADLDPAFYASVHIAFCLSVSATEICDLGNEGQRFLVFDARPREQFEAGRLAVATHVDPDVVLDSEAMHRFVEKLRGFVGASAGADSGAGSSASLAMSPHLCFLGTGDDAEDAFMGKLVLDCIERWYPHVSVVHLGYRGIHDQLSAAGQLDLLADHNPEECLVCYPLDQRPVPKITRAQRLKAAVKAKKEKVALKINEARERRRRARSDSDQAEAQQQQQQQQQPQDVDLGRAIRKHTLVDVSSWGERDRTSIFPVRKVHKDGSVDQRYLVVSPRYVTVLEAHRTRLGLAIVKAHRPLHRMAKISFNKKQPNRLFFQFKPKKGDRVAPRQDPDAADRDTGSAPGRTPVKRRSAFVVECYIVQEPAKVCGAVKNAMDAIFEEQQRAARERGESASRTASVAGTQVTAEDGSAPPESGSDRRGFIVDSSAMTDAEGTDGGDNLSRRARGSSVASTSSAHFAQPDAPLSSAATREDLGKIEPAAADISPTQSAASAPTIEETAGAGEGDDQDWDDEQEEGEATLARRRRVSGDSGAKADPPSAVPPAAAEATDLLGGLADDGELQSNHSAAEGARAPEAATGAVAAENNLVDLLGDLSLPAAGSPLSSEIPALSSPASGAPADGDLLGDLSAVVNSPAVSRESDATAADLDAIFGSPASTSVGPRASSQENDDGPTATAKDADLLDLF